MKIIGLLVLGTAASALLCAQTPPPRPEFEVASIKPSTEGPAAGGGQVHVGVQIDGAQVHCTYLTLKDFIRIAYDVKDYQITGPDWMTSERFDIHAKVPAGGRGHFREMLQNLLADRFQVKLHRASKEFPVYAIVVGKGGLKMKESPLDPESEGGDGGRGAVNVSATGGRGGTTVNYGRGAYFTLADNKFVARKLTMPQLAESIGRFAERPVVDMTGLKGTYDLDLELTTEEYRLLLIRTALNAGVTLSPDVLKYAEGVSDEGLFKGLQGLGLKLESRKAPLEVLAVDSASKTPTAN